MNWTRGRFKVQIDQAIAHSRALEAQKVAAEKDVARYTELIKTGAVSKQELEKAQADAESYDAQIAAKQEEVKQYELDLEFSRITAPIAGRISRAHAHRGQPGECRRQRSAADDDCGDRPDVRVLLGR